MACEKGFKCMCKKYRPLSTCAFRHRVESFSSRHFSECLRSNYRKILQVVFPKRVFMDPSLCNNLLYLLTRQISMQYHSWYIFLIYHGYFYNDKKKKKKKKKKDITRIFLEINVFSAGKVHVLCRRHDS